MSSRDSASRRGAPDARSTTSAVYRAALLVGGFANSTDEQRPTLGGSVAVVAQPFHAHVNAAAVTLVRYRDVLGSRVVVIDARAPDQFRTHQIPGAVNVRAPENLTAGTVRCLLPERDLRELYTVRRSYVEADGVAYCRTAQASALITSPPPAAPSRRRPAPRQRLRRRRDRSRVPLRRAPPRAHRAV